jgi:hypothetical protein
VIEEKMLEIELVIATLIQSTVLKMEFVNVYQDY